MSIDGYFFRGERTIGGYVSREILGGRTIWTAGVSLWVGSIFVTVRR